jgi:TRAP-type mannitol/chloroaromatic compound transport system permease small subunit
MAVLGPLGETRPRAAALLRAAYDLTGAAVIGGMAWATVSVCAKDWASGEFIGTHGLGTMPTWPFRALILLGLAVAALQFLRRAASAVRWAAR